MVETGGAMHADHQPSVLGLLRTFGATDSALGRRFAKRQQMHPTDAAAVVEILDAERQGTVLTPARLAERIGLTAGATSTLVNRLEEAGHVIRTRNQADRRIVGLHSTPKVHADAGKFFAPIGAALQDALDEYSADQLEALERILSHLNEVATTQLNRQEG